MQLGLIVVVVLAVVLIVIGVGAFNKLIAAKNLVDAGLGQIDVMLRRRFDLIPNLVETAKQSMKFESETLEKIVQARTAGMNARTVEEKASADAQATAALGGFFAVAEAYPDLKSNTTLVELQSQLKDTENQIAYARQSYNDAVTNLNTLTEQFPTGMFSGMAGARKREFYQVEEAAAREPVKVDFK
jgi:LemA protein